MLSDAKIRSLKPKEKAYKVYDDRGLYMVVNPNGSRWWRFKYKYDGKERGISLGVYPDVTLQYAREQLQEARQLLARGIDPSAQRRTVKIARADTFKVIAEEWLEMQAERLAPITMTKARWILGSFVYPRLGSRPIAEITAPEVLAVLRPIESRGMNETRIAPCSAAGRFSGTPSRRVERRGTSRPTCGAPWRRSWWRTARLSRSRRRSAPYSAPSTTT